MLVTNDRRGSNSWRGGYRFFVIDVRKASIAKIKIPKLSMTSRASYVLINVTSKLLNISSTSIRL